MTTSPTRSGQTVVFRGFVFVPNRKNTYDAADYTRLKSFGGNYQSIKMLAGAAGYGGTPQPGYLDQLAHMVQMAEQRGIYTNLKMTVYNIPRFSWTAFWKNRNGEQQQYLKVWSTIWQRFKDDLGVIGYDLLNEPEMGSLSLTPDQFQSQYLTPFYQKAIAELRTVDTRHIAFFQPQYMPPHGDIAYLNPPQNLSETAYAPHFYPVHPSFNTTAFLPLLTRFRQEAATAGVPVFIGEYGTPLPISLTGNTAAESQYRRLETYDYTLFAKYGLSYSRPWYSDDRQQITTPRAGTITWSIFPGTTGRNGPYRTWIVDPFMAAARVSPS